MLSVSGQTVRRCLQGLVEGAHGAPSLLMCLRCDVHGQGAEEDGSVVRTAVSKHLSLGWWRRRIHRHNDFFHYSEICGAREVFWAHVNVSPPCCLKPIKNLGILSEI